MPSKDEVTVMIMSRTGEGPEIRQQVQAERYIKETAIYLRYKEPSQDMGATRTTVKIAPLEIRIIRHGDVESEQSFAEGSRRSGFYQTAHGRLLLETKTKGLHVNVSAGSGVVNWEYELAVSGETAGTFSLTLVIE